GLIRVQSFAAQAPGKFGADLFDGDHLGDEVV
ncbi:MAG: hypothetical protein JWR05_1120, partial [Mucilaginibacter sp.]|nr:hypothetical protein [Mucilaginibacter sp.]